MAVRMVPSSTKSEAVITTDEKKLNDLSTEEVLWIGGREALDVLRIISMTASGAPPWLQLAKVC